MLRGCRRRSECPHFLPRTDGREYWLRGLKTGLRTVIGPVTSGSFGRTQIRSCLNLLGVLPASRRTCSDSSPGSEADGSFRHRRGRRAHRLVAAKHERLTNCYRAGQVTRWHCSSDPPSTPHRWPPEPPCAGSLRGCRIHRRWIDHHRLWREPTDLLGDVQLRVRRPL